MVVLLAGIGAALYVGSKRPVGTPVTWGEACVGAMFVFGMMFVAYGVLPHQWLHWADGSLNWRSDAHGIPLGPLGALGRKHENHWFSDSQNVLWPDGITFFGRGRMLVSKQHVRDAIAAGIYIVFLGGQIALWAMWQQRGRKPTTAVEPSSAFGRPLVKRA
jgi:hypothetical protein